MDFIQKEKGNFQHSSFLAGGATTAAGRLLVKDGTIQVFVIIDSFGGTLYKEALLNLQYCITFSLRSVAYSPFQSTVKS